MIKRPKTARYPWAGYRIAVQKQGTKWRFKLISKFNVTVYTSPLDYDRQVDTRAPAKAYKEAFILRESGGNL
jgi:hypothetical protein